MSRMMLESYATEPSRYPSARPAAGWPASPAENASPVSPAVQDELNRFLAGVERRALRVAEFATGGRDEALDVVQDAMLMLATRYADRPAAEWPPLFHRILENKITDWQRRQTVRRRLFGWSAPVDEDGDPLAELPDMTAPEFAEQLKQQQAMTKLKEGLAALPRRQREAFVLRVWDGLSVEETAAAMGCSDGSVKTHLSRALQALRARLEGTWP